MQQVSTSKRVRQGGLLAVAMLIVVTDEAVGQPSLRQVLLSHAGPAHSAAVPEALAAAPAGAAKAPETAEQALEALAQQADVIFAGEVIAIYHDAGAVRVEWKVLQGLLGTQSGQSFVLREWAGLWCNDDARYRIGQRSLVLLHAESVGGFRSPVGGQDGILPLNGDLSTGTTDLRWIAARAARPSAAAPAATGPRTAPVTETSLTSLSSLRASSAPVRLTFEAAASASKGSDADLRAVDANMIMGLLNAWHRRSTK